MYIQELYSCNTNKLFTRLIIFHSSAAIGVDAVVFKVMLSLIAEVIPVHQFLSINR